jgi:hypothetical protein
MLPEIVPSINAMADLESSFVYFTHFGLVLI